MEKKKKREKDGKGKINNKKRGKREEDSLEEGRSAERKNGRLGTRRRMRV